jgi:hypothetical protein
VRWDNRRRPIGCLRTSSYFGTPGRCARGHNNHSRPQPSHVRLGAAGHRTLGPDGLSTGIRSWSRGYLWSPDESPRPRPRSRCC